MGKIKSQASVQVGGNTAALKNWRKWTAEDCLANMDVKESTEEYTREMLLAYITEHLEGMKRDAKNAGGVEPWDYVAGSLSNAINDEDVPWNRYERTSDATTEGAGDQEIIEISKERVKESLRVLLSTRSKLIAELYEKHAEYNAEFFEGALSTPVITIDKMDNRTFATYTYEGDPMAVDQHIKFNVNFIALNEEWRILQTLRHEMIHQWQDEVAYAKPDATDAELKMTKLPKIDTETEAIVFEEVLQRRRPKETHNNDFRLYAAIVGIPANGPNCTGNPANMPEPQSYNRKFVCKCMASNKHRMTIYSTRVVDATCNVCQTKYVEVTKNTGGKTIEVKLSHVEKPGQDAVQDEMETRFTKFVRFESKRLKDVFVDELMGGELEFGVPTAMEQGVYQKGHNAYAWGHRYWVAYSIPDGAEKPKKSRKKSVEVPKAPPAPPVEVEKPEAPTVEPEPVKPVDSQPEPPATQPKPKRTRKAAEPAKEEPKKEEPAKAEKPKRTRKAAEPKAQAGNIVSFPTGAPVPPADDFDPQKIINLYGELLTINKVAAAAGIPKSTLLRKIEKYQIDFNAKTFKMPE